MGLKARVTAEEYEALDDAVQGFYAAKGGEYVLDVDDIKEHPTVQGLSNAFDKEKDRREKLQATVKAFGDATPDDLVSMREELEELRESKGGDLISPEELKELKDRQKELAAKAKRAEDLEKELEFYNKDQTTRLGREIEGALASAGVRKEAVPAAAALIEKRYNARYERGDKGFKPVVTAEMNGVPGEHGLSEFVSEWVESDGAVFLPPSGKGGSGADAGGGGGGGRGKTTFDRSDPRAWGEHAEALAKGEATAK